jgi:hypothetical protein
VARLFYEGKIKMEIRVEIVGRTPLICNKFSDAKAQEATDGTRGSSAAAERLTPQEICKSKLYIGLNGKPMIPQPNLLRNIVQGGAFHKAGKRAITTQRGSMMYACVDIEDAEIPIIHQQPWKVDTRAVRIPSTGGRILCHRPMFDDWRLKFIVHLDTSILSPSLLRQIVDDAGSRCGLGDFRPETKGPYGRYRVDLWEELRLTPSVKIAAE